MELEYDLVKPVNDAGYERLSRLLSVYGLMSVKLKQDLTGMTVEYDATRLNPDGVDHVLKTNGLSVKRIV